MKMPASVFATVALALSLAACGPRTEKTVDAAQKDAARAIDDIGNSASNVLDAAGDALKSTPTGQQFTDKAARSDAFEIAAAELALDRGASTRVKSFAGEMIKAHTESTASIKAAAKKASPGIIPDATLTDQQKDMLADLGKLKGADFDKKYADGQVDAHQTALSLMEDYAAHGDVPSLKEAAGKIAPVVQKHLDMAKALNDAR